MDCKIFGLKPISLNFIFLSDGGAWLLLALLFFQGMIIILVYINERGQTDHTLPRTISSDSLPAICTRGIFLLFGQLGSEHGQNEGKLLFRMDDLDPNRCTAAYASACIEDMRGMGLDWDEGPDLGGPSRTLRAK